MLDALEHHAPGRFTCEFLRPAPIGALVERLEDSTRPAVDILHFDGHGVFDRRGLAQSAEIDKRPSWIGWSDKDFSQNCIARHGQLGLHARVAALVDLTVDPPLPAAYVDSVLEAIEWRNEVIHRTGRLPPDRTEEQLRTGIAYVLGLASTLALRREELAAEIRNARDRTDAQGRVWSVFSQASPGAEGP